MMTEKKTEVIVMLSGTGTTLEAIIANCKYTKVVGVISSRNNVNGIRVASAAGINYSVVDSEHYKSNYNSSLYDDNIYYRLSVMIKDNPNVRYVVLAGYMKFVPSWILQKLNNSGIDVINIHPSLLPDYKGLNTHQRVFDDKQPIHGMTIHYVNEELDCGPIIFQDKFSVLPTDDVFTLEEKVKRLEWKWYPIVLDNLPYHKGRRASTPLYLTDYTTAVTKTAKTELDKFKDNLEACGLGYLLNSTQKPPSDAQLTIERQLGSALLESAIHKLPIGFAKDHLRDALLHVKQAAAIMVKQ